MNPMFALVLALGSCRGLSWASICRPNWRRYDDACYLLITQLVDWYLANRTCVQSKAKLAVPNSQDQQEFLWRFFLRGFDQTPTDDLWIGCNDIEEENNWNHCPLAKDSDGYQNWYADEPNNSDDEDCAVVSLGGKGEWNDLRCSLLRYAVCERPIQKETSLFCLQTDTTGRIASACLVDHIVKELPVTGMLACAKACRSDPRCGSFNLLEIGTGKKQCQLNNATRQEAGELHMKKIEHCYYFNI